MDKVIEQVITEDYAIYNSDCMYVLPSLKDKSIDLSIYSPPFAGLYNYSSSENDFSNCATREEFLKQYEFLISEISRVTKDGRITAVHCTDVMDSKTGELWDFPHEIIKMHARHGFKMRNRITVWKEPLKVRMRTMVKSLMHKLIVEDSTECFTAMPDYVLIFKKSGVNEVPVTHPKGFSEYFGRFPFLIDHLDNYCISNNIGAKVGDDGDILMGSAIESEIHNSFRALQDKYKDWPDPKTNKLSHIIWQRYASSTWDDVRIDNVLPFRDSKEEDDEKHVHPLQLDVIDRLVVMYSNEGETILTPFMGVGSEVFSPVSLNRRAIGIELKESYFKQSKINLSLAKERFAKKTFQLW